MEKVTFLSLLLIYSVSAVADGHEQKVPCFSYEKNDFIGWMTKKECVLNKGISPSQLGENKE
ncbi:hypothetical protein D1115_15800 [Vibrio alfacsensis]|uniref:DUF1496 domain-containing protein n=1 Tax=Vibrio alfacsensis TaxID=1074311 RepID=A0ABM6YXQ4_9VIBR|nr:hypothetical protein [Vibrio alfacsensis]AXY02524.1 hypothetical protein D1115_15800 [Vibrio alfacsensis]